VTGSFFGGIHAFFHSLAWDVIRLLFVLFVSSCWIGTVYWARKDAQRRLTDPRLIRLSTIVAAIPPFLGPLVYMLFRPPEYLDDIRERELEIKAIEGSISGHHGVCAVCGCAVDSDFLACPVCAAKLRHACASCKKPLEEAWQLCPYCETPVTPDQPAARAPTPRKPSTTAPRRRTRASG